MKQNSYTKNLLIMFCFSIIHVKSLAFSVPIFVLMLTCNCCILLYNPVVHAIPQFTSVIAEDLKILNLKVELLIVCDFAFQFIILNSRSMKIFKISRNSTFLSSSPGERCCLQTTLVFFLTYFVFASYERMHIGF